MKTKRIAPSLKTNQSGPSRSASSQNGKCQPPMKRTTKPTSCGTTNHIVASCFATISVSDSDWPMITTPSTLSASETSYDTSCAHVRIEPSSEYFERDAQPPTM